MCTESPWKIAFGRISDPESPDPLFVKTGLDDDPRRPLKRGEHLYKLALYAFEWQDKWSDEEHRDFWTAVIEMWPRRNGQRQVRDTIVRYAAGLRCVGLSDSEIASTLGVEPDTLRRYRVEERAELIWEDEIGGPRKLALRLGPLPPLPRVYTIRQAEPDFTWINLPLLAVTQPREVLDIEARAFAKLSELYSAREGGVQ